jgi:hypothetical protein
VIDPRITERIGSFYGAHFDPVAEKFMETNDHGVLPDEDERANAALRGAQFALSLAPQPVVDREALMQLLYDYAVGRYVPGDLAEHRGFMADAIERLLTGSAK